MLESDPRANTEFPFTQIGFLVGSEIYSGPYKIVGGRLIEPDVKDPIMATLIRHEIMLTQYRADVARLYSISQQHPMYGSLYNDTISEQG